MQTTKEGQEGLKVYEIGYIFVSSIPEEKVADETTRLKDVLTKAGAEVIAFEDPTLRPLAYTMIKKIHGTNHRFTEGYFGWVKFEISATEIEAVKKALDLNENVLRHLLLTTVKENTYLGKITPTEAVEQSLISPAITATTAPAGAVAATVDEMDKSIDDMVKEV